MEIKKVSVLGAGVMGHGIAQVAATTGFDVIFRDIEQKFLDRGVENIRKSLERFVKKEKLTEAQTEETLKRITTTTDLKEAAGNADVVIEAAPEILELKKEIFKELDEFCPPHTILATNTSQFSVTAIASATKRRDKVIGTHWFNPPVMMKLIEVVRGLDTSDETVEIILDMAKKFGKETVVCLKDTPGFITTRLISLWANEAQRILEEGIATMEDIDKACRLAFGHPMGPFETNDYTGLDTTLYVREALAKVYGERYAPRNMLRNLVNAGYLGRKTGRGFYIYDKSKKI
ncbi:MAG: 3-hydroxyacyl-CoA dehydrogenase family protein [bacterium]